MYCTYRFILYEIRHLAPLVFKATLNLRQLSSDWLPHSERTFKQEIGGALMTILGMHAVTNIKRNCRKQCFEQVEAHTVSSQGLLLHMLTL